MAVHAIESVHLLFHMSIHRDLNIASYEVYSCSLGVSYRYHSVGGNNEFELNIVRPDNIVFGNQELISGWKFWEPSIGTVEYSCCLKYAWSMLHLVGLWQVFRKIFEKMRAVRLNLEAVYISSYIGVGCI